MLLPQWPQEEVHARALQALNRRIRREWRRERRRRGAFAQWYRKIFVGLVTLILAAVISYGARSWFEGAHATANSNELRKVTETIRSANRHLAELQVLKRTQGLVIASIPSLGAQEQVEVLHLLAEATHLMADLDEELPRVKTGGEGLGLVRDRMEALRSVFARMCARTRVACPTSDTPEQGKPRPNRRVGVPRPVFFLAASLFSRYTVADSAM